MGINKTITIIIMNIIAVMTTKTKELMQTLAIIIITITMQPATITVDTEKGEEEDDRCHSQTTSLKEKTCQRQHFIA